MENKEPLFIMTLIVLGLMALTKCILRKEHPGTRHVPQGPGSWIWPLTVTGNKVISLLFARKAVKHIRKY